MKTSVYSLMIAAALAACNGQNARNQGESSAESSNSRTSLDWAGAYKGILPAEGYEGIFTQITLNDNNNYKLSKRYFGDYDSLFTAEGTIQWMNDNNRIILHDMTFRVGENRLFLLQNTEESIPASQLTSSLNKIASDDITDIYWRLISLDDKEVSDLVSESSQKPQIILHSYSRRMSGSNSCNRIMGRYHLGDGNTLKFKQISSTRMACQDDRLERLFNVFLENTERYETDGINLILYNDQNAPMKFKRSEIRDF
ncbi:MAG: META domain-containing protein [Thermaurantimonas sp.]